jgi:hypothetical protein
MVVIVVIIMGFVATRQCQRGYAYEEQHAECVFELIFHGGCLCLDVHKPCQAVKGCRTGVFTANMSKNVDISPQNKNATKVV